MNKTDTVLRKLANSWKRQPSWLTNKNILYTNCAVHGSARKTWRGRSDLHAGEVGVREDLRAVYNVSLCEWTREEGRPIQSLRAGEDMACSGTENPCRERERKRGNQREGRKEGEIRKTCGCILGKPEMNLKNHVTATLRRVLL